MSQVLLNSILESAKSKIVVFGAALILCFSKESLEEIITSKIPFYFPDRNDKSLGNTIDLFLVAWSLVKLVKS